MCHHWSSVCLLTTLPRAHCGLTGSGNMVGEPRGNIWETRKGKGQFWANRFSYSAGLPVYPLLFPLAPAGIVVTWREKTLCLCVLCPYLTAPG